MDQAVLFAKNFAQTKQENEEGELMFLIWRECSELRRAYKGVKDEIINNNLDVDTEFGKIYEKMNFLFELIPQTKISPLLTQKLSKTLGIKVKQSLFNPSIQIIKEHIINITEIIQNKQITIENLLELKYIEKF